MKPLCQLDQNINDLITSRTNKKEIKILENFDESVTTLRKDIDSRLRDSRSSIKFNLMSYDLSKDDEIPEIKLRSILKNNSNEDVKFNLINDEKIDIKDNKNNYKS